MIKPSRARDYIDNCVITTVRSRHPAGYGDPAISSASPSASAAPPPPPSSSARPVPAGGPASDPGPGPGLIGVVVFLEKGRSRGGGGGRRCSPPHRRAGAGLFPAWLRRRRLSGGLETIRASSRPRPPGHDGPGPAQVLSGRPGPAAQRGRGRAGFCGARRGLTARAGREWPPAAAALGPEFKGAPTLSSPVLAP